MTTAHHALRLAKLFILCGRFHSITDLLAVMSGLRVIHQLGYTPRGGSLQRNMLTSSM